MRRTVNVRTEEMQENVVLSVSPFFGAAERTKVEHSANVSRCVFFFAVCVLCDTLAEEFYLSVSVSRFPSFSFSRFDSYGKNHVINETQ